MSKFLSFIVLFLWIFAVNCATEHRPIQQASIPEERCDTPVWNAGDAWKFIRSDLQGWEIIVLRVESDSYIVKNPFSTDLYGFDKKTLETKFSINPEGKKNLSINPTVLYFNFPLYIGKKWGKTESLQNVEGVPLNYLIEFKTISHENITVPAGTFKAFKIEYKVTSLMHNSGGIAYIWFSPEVKNIIKVNYEKTGFWGRSTDYELKSFKLK